MTPGNPDKLRIVYRCKDDAERDRRCRRADALVGTPFIQLPGKPDQHKVLFVAASGDKVRVQHVEMVFNDALLMDAISNWGEDGPLYADTLDGDPPIMRETYNYAVEAFADVELPAQLRNPRSN